MCMCVCEGGGGVERVIGKVCVGGGGNRYSGVTMLSDHLKLV